MKKDYIFLSIYVEITLMSIYDGSPNIKITSSTLTTDVNSKIVNLVGGCWDLSRPNIFSSPGSPLSIIQLPILLIKLRRNLSGCKDIHSILNKFETFKFKLFTCNKQKLQDDLIKELTSVYGDKILKINRLGYDFSKDHSPS